MRRKHAETAILHIASRAAWEDGVRHAAVPAGGGVSGDGSFPHVYGPIDVHALTRVVDFEPGASSEFDWPSGVDEPTSPHARSPADNLVEKDERIQRF